MDDVLDRLRGQVERATDPIDLSEISRSIRRRRRSRVLNVAAVVSLVALVVGVVALQSDQREGRTASAPTPDPTNLGLSLERITAPEEADGTRTVVIEFDGELPEGAASHVEDITSVDAPDGLIYTLQDMTNTVWVCADRHFGFGPGAAGQQTIDVLIPAEWLEIGKAAFPGRLDVAFAPAADGVSGDWAGKVLGCGPYKGYVQLSITSVAGLSDPADVRVHAEGDSIQLAIPPDEDLAAQPSVSGDLEDGSEFEIRHDPVHGLCVTIGGVDSGCDDEGPVLSPDRDPATPRSTGRGGMTALMYGYLPDGAVGAQARMPDGTVLRDDIVSTGTPKVWALPLTESVEALSPPASQPSIMYVLADGSLTPAP